MRAADAAHGGRRAVLLVVGVQDEEDVESAFERGIRAVFQLGGAEQHVQKIAGVAQIVIGIHERHAQAVPVGERGERRHLADQAIGLLAARFGIEDVLRVGIESGERGDGGNQHAHRMGVVVKAVEKFLDALVNERVVRDVVVPIAQLRLRGQLAVKNQVGRLRIGAFFRQFLDRIAAVAKDALVAVDESDLAGAGRRVGEGGVVAHHAEIGVGDLDLAEIDGADRVVLDGHFVLAAVAIIGNGERIAPGVGGRRPRLGRIHFLALSSSKRRGLRHTVTLYTKKRVRRMSLRKRNGIGMVRRSIRTRMVD